MTSHRSISEILDQNFNDESLWVAEAGDWISIVPATADRDHLLSITAGGREAFGLSMDISNRATSITPATGAW